ncbi:MAG: S26 family signal peptidase [Thermoplasmata archaeon]
MPDANAAARAVAGTAAEVPRRVRWWWRQRVVVHDESMWPTLRPGDRLLVDRRAYRNRGPRVGDLVVLVDPEAPTRWLVKRVAAVGPGSVPSGPDLTDIGHPSPEAPPGMVLVASDAPGPARDSRRFGPVPVEKLIGKVYWRYAPAGRRGEL